MMAFKAMVGAAVMGLALSMGVGCTAPTEAETGSIVETVSTPADGRFIVADRFDDGTVRSQVYDAAGNTIAIVTFEPNVEPPKEAVVAVKADVAARLCKATVVHEQLAAPRIVAAPRESTLQRLNAIALVMAVNPGVYAVQAE